MTKPVQPRPHPACPDGESDCLATQLASEASNLLHPRDEHVGVDWFTFTSFSQSILFTIGTSPLGSKVVRNNEGCAPGYRVTPFPGQESSRGCAAADDPR